MSAPTEAQHKTTRLMHDAPDHNTAVAILADSEARAVESVEIRLARVIKAVRRNIANRAGTLDAFERTIAERDQLRAEVAKLTASFTPNGMLARENESMRAEVEDLKARITQDHGIVELMEAELKDLKSAGGPPFIRSEAIRNLRDQVCGLKTRAENAEDEKAILTDRLSEAITGQNNEALRHGRRIEELEAEIAKERARLAWLLDNCEFIHWRNGSIALDSNAAIDAAMKEGAS